MKYLQSLMALSMGCLSTAHALSKLPIHAACLVEGEFSCRQDAKNENDFLDPEGSAFTGKGPGNQAS